MNRQTYLFVYGTLRAPLNHHAHKVISRCAAFVGEGTFQGKLYDLGQYPAAVESGDQEDVVTGEIFELNGKGDVFAPLDEYEGAAFERKRVTVSATGDQPISCWIYLYRWPVAGYRRISSGDYVRYRNIP